MAGADRLRIGLIERGFIVKKEEGATPEEIAPKITATKQDRPQPSPHFPNAGAEA